MTQNDQAKMKSVEDLLAQARADAPPVSEELVNRVIADADAMVPAARPVSQSNNRKALFTWPKYQLFGAFGGMVTASCVGFWLGINPPPALDGFDVFGADAWNPAIAEDAAEISGFGWDIEES